MMTRMRQPGELSENITAGFCNTHGAFSPWPYKKKKGGFPCETLLMFATGNFRLHCCLFQPL